MSSKKSLLSRIPHGRHDWPDRLTSRKWILALGACVFFALQGSVAYDNMTQIVIAFLAVQAVSDLAQQYVAGSPRFTSEEEEPPPGD